jgi:hypothetical protein
MSLLAPQQSVAFEQPEAGSYPGICCRIIDLGTQVVPAFEGSESKKQRQLMIGYELAETVQSDGKTPFILSRFYNWSTRHNSSLAGDLNAWLSISPEELQTFDFESLVGRSGLLNIGPNKDKTRMKVKGISPLARGMTHPQPKSEPLVFSLDNFDKEVFEKLPEGIRRIIEKSPEFQALSNGDSEEPDDPDSEPEIPF